MCRLSASARSPHTVRWTAGMGLPGGSARGRRWAAGEAGARAHRSPFDLRVVELSATLSAQLPETGRTAADSTDGEPDERPARGTCRHSTIRDWADF